MTDDVMNESAIVNENVSHETSTETSTSETTMSGVVSFKEMISEDLRSDPSLESIKDVNALAKSYVNAQRMLGSSVRVPGEDASEEARETFYQKLESVPGVIRIPDRDNKEAMDSFYSRIGRPEKPEDYKLDMPVELSADPALDVFKQRAYGAGLTNKQVGEMVGFYKESIIDPQAQQFSQTKTQGEVALKNKWGADYSSRINGAKMAMSHYSKSNPEAVNELINGPAGNNPALIEMLSDLAMSLSESDILKGEFKTQYGMTKEEAVERINEVRDNRSHAFYVDTHPDHGAAVKKMQKYYSIAYPDSQ